MVETFSDMSSETRVVRGICTGNDAAARSLISLQSCIKDTMTLAKQQPADLRRERNREAALLLVEVIKNVEKCKI